MKENLVTGADGFIGSYLTEADEAEESLDIDTACDWKMAEAVLAMRGTKPT